MLGMFRSGTSCVATCFSKLGYYFGGDDELFPADDFNPGGYFEIKDLMNLNRRILGIFGMQHFRIEEIPDHWAEIPGTLDAVTEISNLLKKKLGGQEKWGWKEPQTTVLLPLYREVFRTLDVDPLYVICVRNPLDVCASQRTHSPLPHLGERVVGLWVHYTLSALRESKGAKRTVFLYEQLLEDPSSSIDAAVAMLDGDRPSPDAIEIACDAVRPEWRHNHNGFEGLSEWPELVRETYAMARTCAEDGEGFRNGRYDHSIEGLWRRWRQTREMVRTNALPTGRVITTWQQAGKPMKAEITVVPTVGWQTIRVPISALPGTQIHVDPYQTPCLFWIRKAVVVGDSNSWPADLKPGRTGMLSPVNGLKRLVIWGPDPMILQLPSERVTELEMEIFIQSNTNALVEVVNVLRTNLEYVVQKFTANKR